MKSAKIQTDIKNQLASLGWSQKRFVREYDKNLKYKSKLTVESLKKQLSRPTTEPRLLKTYLEFIESHSDYQKLGLIKPVNTSKNQFDDEFNNKMKQISKSITERIK